MSDPFVHYAYMDDQSDRFSFLFSGTGKKRGYHVGERTSHPHPVYQAFPTELSVSFDLPRNDVPPNNCTADTPIQTHRSATAAQLDSPPLPFLPTLHWPAIPPRDGGNSLPHPDYSASSGAHPLIPHNPRVVAMPTLTGQAQYVGGLMDAHTCHYDPSLGFTNGNYIVESPRGILSPFIPMPIVPTSLGAGPSSHLDLISDPTLRQSPRHYPTTFPDLRPSDPNLSLSPSGTFDSGFYSSRSHLYPSNHYPLSPPREMSPLSQPQPTITTSLDQMYTFTIPLNAIEFPPIPCGGEEDFFQCRWAGCEIWITSDREAVKYHLRHTHNVVLKGTSTDLACCEWVGCSSTPQRTGLVRHFHTHLGLKFLCSVCGAAYTRQDTVGSHTRKEPRCQLAQAISHPSAAAYRARINGDNTVTLTKILQP